MWPEACIDRTAGRAAALKAIILITTIVLLFCYLYYVNGQGLASNPLCFISQAPCIVMVEDVDSNNLYISVSSPNLNFNISRASNDPLEVGSQVTGRERFYSVSMGVEVQVRMVLKGVLYSSESDW